MSQHLDQQRRKRIVIETPSGRHSRYARRGVGTGSSPKSEVVVAASVIGAAALATFLALFLTSRPYDPMNSSVAAQQDVPPSTTYLQPSPKPTPSAQPSATPAPIAGSPTHPLGEVTAPAITDDAAIQAEIERKIGDDPALAGLDINTIVENGRVTLAGSVKSSALKTQVEKLVRGIRGVTAISNQLIVTAATP